MGEEDFCDPLGMGSEEKWRVHQVCCYRAGNEIGGFATGRTKHMKICTPPTCFPGSGGLWVTRVCLLELGAGIKQWVGRGQLGGK